MKLFILLIIVALAYAVSLRFGYVASDQRWLDSVANTSLKTADIPSRALTLETWYQQDGQSAAAHHALNIVLHLAVTALLYAFMISMGLSVSWALVGAAWFGLLALQVESVAYLTGREDVIAALGVLGSCLAARSRMWIVAALCMLIGMAGKETAVIGLVLVPLVVSRWRLSAFSALSALAGTTWYAVTHKLSVDLGWMELQSAAAWRMMAQTIIPGTQSAHYAYYIHFPWQVLALAGLIALSAWAMGQTQARHLVSVGLLWTLACVGLRLYLRTPTSVFPEHQWYLPSMGVILAACAWGSEVETRWAHQ